MSIATETRTRTYGRYDVEFLTESGMSTIYDGRDSQSGREVILKVVPTADFERASALMREREALIRLDHAGVVRCLDLFSADDETVLVLEKVPGHDLGHLLALRDTRPTEAQVRDWGLQLARILQYLHEQRPPVIYRDLKPSNIILRPDGQLVLVDFGASRVRSDVRKDTVQLGTPGYAAPEQYGAATDERTDVYTLGVTLFELLSSRDPAAYGFNFPPLRELGVDASPSLEAIVARAVNPDVNQRFPSMQAMIDALSNATRSRGAVHAALWAPLAIAVAALGAFVTAHLATMSEQYGAALAVVALSVAAGFALARRSLTPQESDVPPLRRNFPFALFIFSGAALGAAPLVFPLSFLSAHLRRVSLDVFAAAVPVDGTPEVIAAITALLSLTAFLGGVALVRRGAWVWPAAMCALLVSLFGTHVAIETHRDNGLAPTSRLAPLWTTDFGMVKGTRDDMSLLARPGQPFFAAVRTGSKTFAVLDAETGKVAWRGDTSEFQPLNGDVGLMYTLSGNTLTARDPHDGQEIWHYRAAAEIRQYISNGFLVVSVNDGSVRGFTLEDLKGDVAPRWTIAQPNAKYLLCPTGPAGPSGPSRVSLIDQGNGQLNLVDPHDGTILWHHAVNTAVPAETIIHGSILLYATVNDISVFNVDNGELLTTVPLPPLEGRPQGFEPVRMSMIMVDDQHVLIPRSDGLWCLSLSDRTVTWRLRLPGEWLVPLEAGPGTVVVTTSGGKLLGVQPQTGHVTWEWWNGGFVDHLLACDSASMSNVFQGLAYVMQPAPGSPLCWFDASSASVTWRLAVPPGLRVSRMLDGGDVLLTLSHNREGHLIVQAFPRSGEMPMQQRPGVPPPIH